MRTISKLLDIFEARGLLTAPVNAPSASADVLEKPSDDRAWIVRELLDTERKYVQDLEVMQNYARALGQHDILPPDTIHALFGNLNTLVDVNRRFLICVEENVRRPADEQHFGHVFQTMVRHAPRFFPVTQQLTLCAPLIGERLLSVRAVLRELCTGARHHHGRGTQHHRA